MPRGTPEALGTDVAYPEDRAHCPYRCQCREQCDQPRQRVPQSVTSVNAHAVVHSAVALVSRVCSRVLLVLNRPGLVAGTPSVTSRFSRSVASSCLLLSAVPNSECALFVRFSVFTGDWPSAVLTQSAIPCELAEGGEYLGHMRVGSHSHRVLRSRPLSRTLRNPLRRLQELTEFRFRCRSIRDARRALPNAFLPP